MAKLMLLMQLLVLQTAYIVGVLDSDWQLLDSYPHECKLGNDCKYESSLKYLPEQNALLFRVLAPCSENLAVAIGITTDYKLLKNIDVIWGFFKKDKLPLILHGHMDDASKKPVVYKESVLLNPKLIKKHGLCLLEFAHPRVSNIPGDFNFPDKAAFYAVLARDGLTIKDDVAISFPKRPVTSNLILMDNILSNLRERTPEISFVYPLGCEKTDSCVYVLHATLDKDADLVRFSVKAKIVDKKIKMCSGIGFSRNKTMNGMDFVYSCLNNKTYHMLFDSLTGKPKQYPTLDLPEVSVMQKDGHLVMNFAHKRRPSNEGDFCFVEGECYYFWYPYSGLKLDNAEVLDLKNVKAMFSQHKICIECPEETTTVETTPWIDVDDTTPEPETTCDHETTVVTTEIAIDETTEPWTTEETSTPEPYGHPTPSPHDEERVTTEKPCIPMKGICYYNSSAQYRKEPAKFLPKDMLTSLCSHLSYSSAKIENNKLIPADPNDLMRRYKEFNDRKQDQPDLKTFLAVVGHNFPIKAMTTMLSSPSNRKTFIDSVIVLLKKHKFDGLDLHCDAVEIKSKPMFTLLIQEIRTKFNDEFSRDKVPLLLMVSVCGIVDKITCDIKTIHKNVDLMHLKAFDYHSSHDIVTGLNAPLFAGSTEKNTKLNIDYSAKYMISSGIPEMKLIIGMPMYGIGFKLTNPSNHDLSAPVSGPSTPGDYTKEAGLLSYYEICILLRNRMTKTVWLDEQKVNYLYSGNQWVSYEDEKSLTEKMNWLKTNSYGGWSAWDMSLDDFHGDICLRGPFPLVKLMKKLDNKCLPAYPLSTILSSTTTKPVTTTKTTPTTKTTKTTPTTTRTTPTTTKTTKTTPTTTKTTPTTTRTTPTTTKTTTTKKPTTIKTTRKLLLPTTTTKRTTTHTTMTTTTMPSICKAYTKIEDPKDCKSYIFCSAGNVPIKMKCEDDLYFNPESSECEELSQLPPERRRKCRPYVPK